MNIKTHTIETREVVTVETVSVASNVDVQRITTVRTTGTQTTSSVTEHVVHHIVTDDTNFGHFAIIEPELIDDLRLTGWFSKEKQWSMVSKTPFTRVMDCQKPYQIVRIKHYDNTVYDVDGKQLPVAIRFNYIDGNVNDYNFDLKGLLQHLKARQDCLLHTERFGNSLIHTIPSYNVGGTSGYYGLEFVWQPTTELFRQYVELASKNDRFFRLEAAHTVMGNDKFRITHKEDENS